MLLALLTATTLHAQITAAPTIENERVKVWDITLNPGQPTPLQHHDLDTVTMYLTGGDIRTTTADGKSTTATHDFGDAVYTHAGVDQKLEVVSANPARIILVELKNHPEPPYVNKTGYPAAFPRAGSKQVLDNDRISVWNYTWTPNVKTQTHYHDKDILVVYRYTGSLDSITLDGKVTTTDYNFGNMRFNRGDRTHYEVLSKGQQSAMMLELK